VAREARLADRLHEWGYRWTWPPRIDDLSPRQLRLVELANHTEQYIRQERRKQQRHERSDRPDHFTPPPSGDSSDTDDRPYDTEFR